MITKKEFETAAQKTVGIFEKAGIVITGAEHKKIEVADFGLSDLERVGLEILTYINTERVCAKELVLFARQTCPQHKHVSGKGSIGKEETFRCRKGKVYLYVEGDGDKKNIRADLPPTKVNVFKEVMLSEGEQYTIFPNTWHWFQAGAEGAIVSEFSTCSTDETDVFYDEDIKRSTLVK